MKAGSTSSRSAALLAPKKRGYLVWLETPLVMGGALAIAWGVNPGNPLFIGEPAPWIWLAPTLLALRYGALAGMVSVGMLVGAWGLFNLSSLANSIFPGQYFLGVAVLSLMAGEFSDIWHGRLSRVREVGHYLDRRLNSLTHRHFLLKHAFQRLEQELIAKPVLLRDSLVKLRGLIAQETAETHGLPGAEELLRVLAQSCQIEVAGLYADHKGKITVQPVATLGEMPTLDLHDPLLTYSVRHTRLCHVQSNSLREVGSRYLVVAPVLNVDGRRLGLLVVERMPFLALNNECLQLLNANLSYYADMVVDQPRLNVFAEKFPDCPPDFVGELWRLHRIYHECRVDSTLVALNFEASHEARDQLFEEALRQCRRLDTTWPLSQGNSRVLLTLMPLYEREAVKGYLARIEKHLRSAFGIATLAESGIRPLSVSVGKQPLEEALTGLLESCHAG